MPGWVGLGRHGRSPRRIGPRARTAEAWPPRHEQRRVIEDARERRALALASAFDNAEGRPGALPAGRAAPDLVDRKTVCPRERARYAAPASGPGGARQPVTRLAGLDMIRPRAPPAAPARVGPGKMGLPVSTGP